MDIDYIAFKKLNPKLVRIIAKSYKRKQEEKFATMNYNAWLNNLYTAKAINANFPKGEKYPNKPIDFSPKKELSMKEKLELWAIAINAEFDKKHPECKTEQ
jgi:hypothetical protein